MRKLLVLFLLFTCGLVFSQEGASISGTILDKEVINEPLIYAEVHLRDTPNRVQTNFRGNFVMTDVAPGSYTLVIDYLGYESLEIPVTVKENEQLRLVQGLAAKQLTMEDMSSLNSVKATGKAMLSEPSKISGK